MTAFDTPDGPFTPETVNTAVKTPIPLSSPTAGQTSQTPIQVPSPTLSPTPEKQMMRFTVVYDNNKHDPALTTAWGFSCWVENGKTTVLFDTGGDGATLASNMAKLNLDPHEIDAVVLSHIHNDHVGGLLSLLDTGITPTVYVPTAFPASFKANVSAHTDLVEVSESIRIAPNIYTTGQVGTSIVEQALIVKTSEGLVIVTGCAHPGIVNMVHRAKEVTTGEVVWVIGGFHLGGANQRQVSGIISDFRQLGVQRVAPCHCTGDRARQMFVNEYGENCTLAGVGSVISVGFSE
jgi:7,8-dihydropterin-6-yl-methyl-4-(beta-D-ribofuranosyl)aminobenzene 5'-phosphate synthase